MSERLKKLIGDDLYSKIEEAAKKENIKVKDIDIIPNNYITLSRFNEVNNELKTSKEKLTSYETQQKDIEKMLKDVNAENINDLMNNFNSMTEKHRLELEKKDIEMTNYKKTTMVKEYLTSQGAKHTELLINNINLDNIKIDNEKLIGISDITKNLKESYKELFIEKRTNTNKPPKNTDSNDNDNDNDGNNIFTSLLKGGSL